MKQYKNLKMQAPRLIMRSMLAEMPSMPASTPKLYPSSEIPFHNEEAVILYTESNIIPPEYSVLRIALIPESESRSEFKSDDCPGSLKVTLYGKEEDGVYQWMVDTINIEGISVTPGGFGFRSDGGITWEVPTGFCSVAELTRTNLGTGTEIFMHTGLQIKQKSCMGIQVESIIQNIRLNPLTHTIQYIDFSSIEPEFKDESKIILVDFDGKVVWHFSKNIFIYLKKVHEMRVPIFMVPVMCVWRDMGTTIVEKTTLSSFL